MWRLRGEMSEEDHYHGRIKRHNNYDKKELSEFFRGLFRMEDEFIRGAEEAGHDGKGGLKRNADDLAMILENLGNRVRQIIWANVSGRRAK